MSDVYPISMIAGVSSKGDKMHALVQGKCNAKVF